MGRPIPSGKGLDALQILDKAESGEIRGLYVVGENPLETYPERTKTEKALGNLEFLVVQDLFLTSTAKMAHAVLPVASFAEKIGTYTSAERLVQRIRPVLTSAKGKSDMEIFTALAALMGSPAMTYAGPEQVMNEIASMVDVLPWYFVLIGWWEAASHGHASMRKILGRAYCYEGGFPGGKARFLPAAPAVAQFTQGLPLRLVPGILKFHSGSFSEWSSSLMEVCPEGFAEMNSKDMKELGLQERKRKDHIGRRDRNIRSSEKILSGPKGHCNRAGAFLPVKA